VKRTPNLYDVELDPEIKNIVVALNHFGFVTYLSCAGHSDRGYISFKCGYDHKAIKAILSWRGLQNIEIEESNDTPPILLMQGITAYIRASFDPIGKNTLKIG